MTAPIPDCPQPETPLRTRAWTAEQMANLKKPVDAGEEAK